MPINVTEIKRIESEESFLVKKQVTAISDTLDTLSRVSESAEILLASHLTHKAIFLGGHAYHMHIMNDLSLFY